MSQKLVALGNKSWFPPPPHASRRTSLDICSDWMIRDIYVHKQGDRCCSSSSPPSGGFFLSCWGLCPAACPFYQNSPVFPVSEETEMLCSNPADCCVAFCSRAPACPLLTDWAKDNTATRPAASAPCLANELRRCKTHRGAAEGIERPEPGTLKPLAPLPLFCVLQRTVLPVPNIGDRNTPGTHYA